MKETGLIFKSPLVRAILEGRKTQTRRVVKRLPLRINRDANAMEIDVANIENGEFAKRVPCPMGKPGDRIYVREKWNPDPPCDGTWCYTQWAGCRQGQIEGVPERFRSPEHCNFEASWQGSPMTWTPSIHMPKWAARIWLEVTGVRVERLQDISEKDAIAEGIERTEDFFDCPCWRDYSEPEGPDASVCPDDPIGSFQTLWESTGGDWAANPWVWVVDFKVLSTTGRPA